MLYELLRSKDIKPAHLARALGVNKGNVSHWNARRVPEDRVEAVAKVTGIPREELRPDLYKRAPHAHVREAAR